MHKLFFPFLILAGLVTLYSCQKEVDYADSTNNAVTGDFRAKINGNQWVANKMAGAARFGGFISIGGSSTDKKYLSITLKDSGVHNYTLSDMTLNAASYIDSSLPNPINFTTNQGINPGDAGGTVNITSIDPVNKKISGTFSFKVFRQSDGQQRTLTEGSFTNLSYVTSLPPPSTTDTFRVKIAGVSWTPHTFIGVLSPALPPLIPAKIAIVANDATASKTVGVSMPADVTPGTYTFDFFGGVYIGQYNPDTNPSHSQASTSGTLTILSHNTTTRRIRGNFNFHAEELLNPLVFTEITEGYFAITY